jgi:hypothetical protein
MAYKIVNQSIHTQRPPSAEDLRRTFETAVCELYQTDLAARKRVQYHSPIVPRRKILGICKADAEKLAVSEAARCLAALWKV